jgi:toxin YoeB
VKKIVFDVQAWEDLTWWIQHDRRVVARVMLLIADIQRDSFSGIGKPELLRHQFAGYWSRRVTEEHRLIYRVVGDEIRIASCRYHYEA